ncbi:phospholipase C, phosphocholine-specific [Dyella sp. M7H15-1]|uniref:phosphocholine-specific phospholipase C n=1 Tax=Dyella sp. M7H15-1 TaxID=2501295 RepID=UPI001004E3B5|nr:phospholipase C, phosphocholine-specific [Dyella sp. M7H15-1]QAU24362.1 phospholipase C, phosphocholine-specific [Dyella sp. M7H15-1]
MTMSMNRRRFLQLLGSTALASALPASIARALEISANRRTGSIEDIEHIVILMQENRSFDHYFGSLKGVRGFGDPRPVNLTTGNSVWYQPNGSDYVLPFRPTAPDLGLQFLEDLAHDWTSTHAAWNQGQYDQWVPSKGTTTMAYLTRDDIPFHYALADAFTICDAYHCSVMGPTDPNRYYMWTGWVGNDGAGGGPVIDNAEAGYDWSTYPEVLEKAGISWKVYQDIGTGLNADGHWGWTNDAYMGNYGDNALLYFNQYRNASPGSPLYQGARTGTDISQSGTLFDILRADVIGNTLPKVSWIAAPEAYTEHPNWPANYGAWYVSQVLDALTSNPDVFSKMALFIIFDENDGFFDHMVPPCVPPSHTQGESTVSIANEIFPGSSSDGSGPYGMGPRVPMIVVSPWSKGGWVCSEVFDHTSLIRFIERRFERQYPDLRESNITAWRRTVAGDLTSAFDFSKPDGSQLSLPSTSDYQPPNDQRYPDYVPTVPADQSLPDQEPGMKLARALPYELHATARSQPQGAFGIMLENTGKVGACFQVRAAHGSNGPWYYTVESGKSLFATLPAQAAYDYSVYGPNGFMRHFKGDRSSPKTALLAIVRYDIGEGSIMLELANDGHDFCNVSVENLYNGESVAYVLQPGERQRKTWYLGESYGWYDLIVRADVENGCVQRFAGHVETGEPGMTDPAIAQPRWRNLKNV